MSIFVPGRKIKKVFKSKGVSLSMKERVLVSKITQSISTITNLKLSYIQCPKKLLRFSQARKGRASNHCTDGNVLESNAVATESFLKCIFLSVVF